MINNYSTRDCLSQNIVISTIIILGDPGAVSSVRVSFQGLFCPSNKLIAPGSPRMNNYLPRQIINLLATDKSRNFPPIIVEYSTGGT